VPALHGPKQAELTVEPADREGWVLLHLTGTRGGSRGGFAVSLRDFRDWAVEIIGATHAGGPSPLAPPRQGGP
jgi:hypothetical protein